MSILKTLSDDELIREIWNNGTEREREIVRRLERLHQQIDEVGRRMDDVIGGEPPLDTSKAGHTKDWEITDGVTKEDCIFHVKQAD